ncbi:leucyl aminopeptidase [Buchnera aphidicola (Hyadaphis tataricae)]|uniref:Probable cytosol aminopeptidase n=1 Tax=Buchnera aphidicola (Hyadaphis tataricae) TaxID=1241859 RepID=A0A4D6Y6V6_9GAMM|nr:leucyl aminopeptidase [Buchnera aphidicola]QCI21660.1 leucyl aminopeptidase [Buchnera aphidicola (Hyadaphis tataricae)]
MKFILKHCHLEKEYTDCIIVGIFESLQLSRSANYLDSSSNGYITSLLKLGDIKGNIGETIMFYNIPNVTAQRVLLIGLGKKNTITQSNLNLIIKKTITFLKKTSIKNFICSLDEINIENNHHTYWLIRTIVLGIQSSLYQISKINQTTKKHINFDLITLNILKKNDLYLGEIALKHALAINLGITSTKNISNLPPNICTPLYLSNQAKKLADKYSDNIVVDVIDIKEMKKLKMNAYIAVGGSSKNQPFMSVIKYSGNNNINNITIALVGKGVTFDSGGISIKPSTNMHEMKYDMSGAAAVYGTLIMAAELQLPLKIIGILSGCENILSSNAFRPGDVLKTMSGKTVEILNTDAEGRLVLCDTLTYVERFSPNLVIDIATLTGACVVALGECVSGFFANDEELSKQLQHASKETDDKIWRLPLLKEYETNLYSSIADLSNIGNSKAGAITAACFLSNFTKQYKWAHLDIAGTAWESGKDKGSTGRPVELLCQFLLNQSKISY